MELQEDQELVEHQETQDQRVFLEHQEKEVVKDQKVKSEMLV